MIFRVNCLVIKRVHNIFKSIVLFVMIQTSLGDNHFQITIKLSDYWLVFQINIEIQSGPLMILHKLHIIKFVRRMYHVYVWATFSVPIHWILLSMDNFYKILVLSVCTDSWNGVFNCQLEGTWVRWIYIYLWLLNTLWP